MTCCHLLEAQFKEQAKRHIVCTVFFKLIKLKLNMLFKSILFAWQHHKSRHCICKRMRLFKYYKPMQLFFLICFLWLYYVYVFLCINRVHVYENKFENVCWMNCWFFSSVFFFHFFSLKILASFIFKCFHCKLLWIIEK